MREVMAKLLGKEVFFYGIPAKRSLHGDELHVLLKPARVRLLDTSMSCDKMYDSADKVDHLWLILDSEYGRKNIKPYRKHVAVGTVYEYWRSDGSHDYAIQSRTIADGKKLIEDMNQLVSSYCRMEAIDSCEEVAQLIEDGVYLLCNTTPHDQLVHNISSVHAWLQTRAAKRMMDSRMPKKPKPKGNGFG